MITILVILLVVQLLIVVQQIRLYRAAWSRMHDLHERLDRMYREAGSDKDVKLFKAFLDSERDDT